MTTIEEVFAFESESNDGLLGVVTRAERLVLERTEDPIGVLGIELVTPAEGIELFVEAAYAERFGRGVVERLDVRFRREFSGVPDAALTKDALHDFGGTAFTNVCLAPPRGEELVDVTLYFPSKIAFWSSCTSLIADSMSEKDRSSVKRVLDELGIGSRRRGDTLAVPRHALRKPLSVEQQLRALSRADAEELRVDFFAATLPVTRSVRVSLSKLPDSETKELTCILSRRIGPEQSSIAADAVALKEFLGRHFDFDFDNKSFRVENAHGDRAEHHPHGPMGSGQRLQWSLNWGARRK